MELIGLNLVKKLTEVDAGKAVSRAEHSTELLQQEMERLEERVDELSLLAMALWTLLKVKTDVTEEELQRTVAGLKEDRQAAAEAESVTCPLCGRAMLARARRCLYCEYRAPEGDAFSQVTR